MELEAVNLIISTIGEAPVNQLDTATEDVSRARQMLHAASREIQSKGWHFNTENALKLLPDPVTGEIVLADNILRIDVADSNFNIIQRGRKLYDATNHTFNIGTAVSTNVVYFLPFNDLPEIPRQYITEKAGLRFQTSAMGSQLLHMFTKEREQELLVLMQEFEQEIGGYNIFNSYELRDMRR